MDAKDNSKRTTLRLPQDLYNRVETVAGTRGRSLNAEIIATLEREYPGQDSLIALRAAIAERLPLLSRAYNEEEERRLQAEVLDLIRRIEAAASNPY